MAAIVVATVLVLSVWWVTHPRVFPGYGNGVGVRDTEPGVPVQIMVTSPSVRDHARRVHVLAATPRVESAPEGATVTTVWCQVEDAGNGVVGVARGPVRSTCAESRPAAGSTLDLGVGAGQQILLVVKSPRPGRVVVAGVTLTYRDGVRFGRQHVGPRSVVSFTSGGSTGP